jgi:tyrosinase
MAAGVTLTRYDITDLNDGKIEGFPVDDPPGWDAISLFYAKALQRMGFNPSGQGTAKDAPPNPNRDPFPGTPNPENTWKFSEEPDSYFFWGAMHWWPGHNWELWNKNAPAPQNEYWSHCTHGPANVEKYFLPWHRAYIYYYEVAIRRQVAALGGPEDWALPYWNYSLFDANDPSVPWPRSKLPWIFSQPELPDGSVNPLFYDTTRRGLQPTWPDGQDMYLGSTTPFYSEAFGETSWEPAAPRNGFNFTLDMGPHGPVHVDTGTGDQLISPTGWMQNTQTAGFDPIFWLHHSEIDRFWVGWNAGGGEDPQQTDPAWATASDDPITGRWNFWATGDIKDVIVVHPGDMVDPEHLSGPNFPYSYRYQDLPEVPAPQPSARAAVSGLVARSLAGASADAEIATHDGAIEVEHEPVSTRIAVASGAQSLLAAFDAPGQEPSRIVLQLDGIVTTGPPGNYEVYLNNPGVDRDTAGQVPHYVGIFSSFGAGHSHGDHVHGMSATYDITDLVAYLRANGEWDDDAVTVTFVPAARTRAGLAPVIAPVTVGSVRVVTE